MRYYAVFDTNVLISSLLTKRTGTATAQVVDVISTDKDIRDQADRIFSDIIVKMMEYLEEQGIELAKQSSTTNIK